MILENFKINEDMISIDYADRYLDLHNCFNLHELTKIDEDNSVVMKFNKNDRERVTKNELLSFKLKFKNTSEVFTKNHEQGYTNENFNQDNSCPDLFGFSFSGDVIMDGPTDYKKSNEELKTLIFTFVTGRSIKIMADSVELIE